MATLSFKIIKVIIKRYTVYAIDSSFKVLFGEYKKGAIFTLGTKNNNEYNNNYRYVK